MSGDRVKAERWSFGCLPDEFFTFLESCHVKRKRTYVISHNLGFDVSCVDLWARIEQQRYSFFSYRSVGDNGRECRIGATCLNDPPTIIDTIYTVGGNRVTWVDTLNYWRDTLSDLGDAINLPQILRPCEDANLELWYCYARRNCRVIIESVMGLIRRWRSEGLGSWRPTAAGLAYTAFRTRFMQSKILVHGHKKALALERDGYYGGYVACRFSGQCGTLVWERDWERHNLCGRPMPRIVGPVYHIDVNSMYPYAMREHCYPVRLTGYQSSPTLPTLLLELRRRGIVARVRIRSGQEAYPKRDKCRTMYPSGRFWTTLCGPELALAAERGHIDDVSEYATYAMAPIFSGYVDYFGKQKEDAKVAGNSVRYGFAKLMLNSLNGKFAQRSPRWVYEPGIICDKEWGRFFVRDKETRRVHAANSVGGHAFVEQERGEGYESVPIISAYITSHARCYLNHLVSVAGPKDVYYVDTDSLFVSHRGYERMGAAGYIDGSKLGRCKVLGVYDYCEFRGVKDYTTDTHHVVAGVKSDASWGADGWFSQWERERLPSLLTRRPDGVIIARRVEKRIGSADVTGRVGPDGWVSPIKLGE